MSEIKKYKKYLNFKANPRYLRRDFIVPLYTGTEPDIVPEASVEELGMVVDPSRILPKNFTDDMPFVTDENNPEQLELADGGSVERQGFKFGTRKELIDKMSKTGFNKYPSFLKNPDKLAKSYNIKTKPSPDNKSYYLYDIPSDKKLSSILETIETNRTRPRSGAFKKAQEILNNPKLKKEFIKFGSQQGVTGKQIREKYKISTSEFFQSGLRDLFDKNFQTDYKASVRPETIERMKQILNNKKFNKLLNEGILPEHKDLKKTFKLTPNEASTAILRIGQSFTGQKFENIENLNIPKNKKAGKMLLDKISKTPFGNAYSSAARTAILNRIDSQMGNKTGSFDSFRKTIINTLKDNGLDEKLLKNFDLNEIAGVSATGKNKMAPYAYFVNLVDSKINQRELASFNNLYGRKTNELIKAVSQSKRTGDDTKIKEILNSFEESKNNFLDNIRPKVRKEIERVGLPGLSINSPEIEFGKRRINQLSKLGLDLPTTFEKTGVTMTVPKGSFTLQDLKNNPEALTRFISTIGCPRTEQMLGGRVNFSNGSNCYVKGLEKIQSGELGNTERRIASEFLKEAGADTKLISSLAKGGKNAIRLLQDFTVGLGPGGALLTAGISVPFALAEAAEGASTQRMIGAATDIIPGLSPIIGTTRESELRKKVGPELEPYLKNEQNQLRYNEIENEIQRLEKNIQDNLLSGEVQPFGYQQEKINELKEEEKQLEKDLISYKENPNVIKKINDFAKEEQLRLEIADLKKFGKPIDSITVEEKDPKTEKEIQEKQKNLERLEKDVFSKDEPYEETPEQRQTIEEIGAREGAAEGGYIDYIRDYNRYARGGRIHLSEGGGGPKLSRRGFLGFLAGAASLPFVGKLMKGKKTAQAVKIGTKVLPKVAGMPDWFNPLVTRIMNEGVDISPKAERVEDIVKVKKLEFPMPEEGTTKFRKSGIGFEKKNIETITMTEYPDGTIEIEADVFGSSFDAPYTLTYRPPKLDINVQTGEPVKYPGDFSVIEQRPRPDYSDPGNFEIDYESMSVEDAISDLEKLEKIGTGKRIPPKKVEQRTGARKFVEENPSEDIVNRYGDGEIEYDRMKDEGLFDETE